MRTSNSFGIHFILRMNKQKNGSAPVYARISVNGERIELSLRKLVKVTDWNAVKGLAKPKSVELKTLNNYLEQTRGMLSGIYQELSLTSELITPNLIKNKFLGVVEHKHTLNSLMDYHNLHMIEVLAPGTMKNYYTTQKYLKEFAAKQFKKEDLYLTELNYEFITHFEYFLRKHQPVDHQKGMTNNGVMKHLERFRKVIRLGVKMEWLDKDPFAMFKLKMNKVERGFLTKEELFAIEDKQIKIPRVQFARDVFVFSCYTGMAYIDVMQLTPQNIIKGIDGNQWIKTFREKTDTAVNVPLLPKALRIVEAYKEHPRAIAHGTIFPVISNQKLNSYLKEIGDICGIEKNLTFHLARHTFATSVTLSNGVPIETVSKMLGHTSIRTTQIYAKVVEHKVSFDMERVRERLEQQKNLSGGYMVQKINAKSNETHESFDDLLPLSNIIKVTIHQNQEVVSGSVIKLRLLDSVIVNGIVIPKNQFIYGIASIDDERLQISLKSLRYKDFIFPISLSAFDLDGLQGLYIPGSINRDASKKGVDDAIQNLQIMTMDPSLSAQATTAGVQAAKGLFSKKVKQVRVKLKAGYQLLLQDNNQKNL